MAHVQVEKIIVPFHEDLLKRWKARDSSIVPEYALSWAGDGVSNGFGFGEWLAETFFRNKGYYVINDEYDLYSKISKYKRYNDIIRLVVGKEKVEAFSKALRDSNQLGYKTENLDLFVYNRGSCFFAEAKKGKDFLRESQIRFMYLVKEILQVDCKLIYLSETEIEVRKEIVKFEIEGFKE